jgi:hypothetical protein
MCDYSWQFNLFHFPHKRTGNARTLIPHSLMNIVSIIGSSGMHITETQRLKASNSICVRRSALRWSISIAIRPDWHQKVKLALPCDTSGLFRVSGRDMRSATLQLG